MFKCIVQWHQVLSRGGFGCHSLVGEGDASEVWWVETRDAAESPTMHEAAPYDRVTWP